MSTKPKRYIVFKNSDIVGAFHSHHGAELYIERQIDRDEYTLVDIKSIKTPRIPSVKLRENWIKENKKRAEARNIKRANPESWTLAERIDFKIEELSRNIALSLYGDGTDRGSI